MVVKHKIEMDLAGLASMPRVDMVQHDQYTRRLEFTLSENGTAWTVPDGISAVVCFLRSDGTGGEYDTLPGGESAWSAEENVLTVELAPPVFFVPGPVLVSVELMTATEKISTFSLMLHVHESVLSRVQGSDADYPMLAHLPLPRDAEVGTYLRISAVDENGRVTEIEARTLPDTETVVDEVMALLALQGGTASGSWGTVAAQTINVTGTLSTDAGIQINFNNTRIQGVKAPANDTDAANKAYVDSAVSGIDVPDYWQEAVDAAAEKVTALQDAAGRRSITFAWFSDCHVQQDSTTPNPGHTGSLAGAVMKQCHIPYALMCGDAARSDGNALTSEAEMRESLAAADAVLEPIGWEKLLQVQGNHDGSWGYDSTLADPYFCYQMDAKALYGAIFRKQEQGSRVFGGDGSYFYVDHSSARVRFILLNSLWVEDGTDSDGVAVNRRMRTFGFGNDQLNWLAYTALHFTEEGWTVVLASHVQPGHETVRDGAVLMGILEAFVNRGKYTGSYGTSGVWDYVSVSCDYSSACNADIAGFFCGHEHKDQILGDIMACPVITITSDANLSYDETEEARVMGTDKEHALDFVTIDLDSRTVQLTRLGVGSDRSYSYGASAETGITNLADPTDGDWVNDSRLNSSSEVVEYAGSCVTNWIPCSDGDVIYISGLDILDATSGYLAYYRNDSAAYESAKCVSHSDHFTVSDSGVISFTVLSFNSTVPTAWGGAIRFSGALTADSAEDVVITVNQEI